MVQAKNKFYEFSRRLYEERAEKTITRMESVEEKGNRNVFYDYRKEYIQLTGDTGLAHQGKDPKNIYIDWCIAMLTWYIKSAEKYGVNKLHWWRLRDKMGITTASRTICDTEFGPFLVTKKTRHKVTRNTSFIIFCEKETVREKLAQRLRQEGYNVNVLSTGGFRSGDVGEVVVVESEMMVRLDDPTFYILMLGDFDVAGVQIMIKLEQLYGNVVNLGVHRDFLDFLKRKYPKEFDMRMYEERVINKKVMRVVRDYISTSPDYDDADFAYLQGTPYVAGKKDNGDDKIWWDAKRIEIDAIYAHHGIEPFVDYALEMIESECEYWDLRRIGINDFELEEPMNHYEDKLREFNQEASEAYADKHNEQEAPKDEILKIVRDTLKGVEDDIKELLEKYWTKETTSLDWDDILEYRPYRSNMKLKTDEIDNLMEDHKTQMEKKWVPDYEDELKDINDQIDCYEGDVREGESKLEEQFDDLQQELEDAKEDDSYLKSFQEELDEIDWGKEELEQIPIPDEKELLKKVIDALQKEHDGL